MKRSLCLIALLALAACGVDGEPEQPVQPVLTNVGIHIGSGGHVGGTIGVSRGPLTVGVGIF